MCWQFLTCNQATVQLYSPNAAPHADKYDAAVSVIRTGMCTNIKLIRKHPKIRRILRCESPYFHH